MLLAEVAEHRTAALVLDEFQAITGHGAHLPDLLKGLTDTYPGVSLVVAGSQRHLTEELVLGKQAPLYGMAEHLSLPAIPERDMVSFVVSRTRSAGKTMNEDTAREIVRQAGPVPNDIQRLAFEAFATARKEIVTDDASLAMEAVVDHESSTYAARLAELTLSRPEFSSHWRPHLGRLPSRCIRPRLLGRYIWPAEHRSDERSRRFDPPSSSRGVA